MKALEKTLLESIATISCTYKKGIGFFGNYSLSQESKDMGYNSLIVTNQSLISDCIRNSGGSITIGFNGKNYNSVYSGFNVDGTDLATVISSLSPPQISLYDNYWPKLGSWVYIAYFVESFGIIFRSSKVQLINESTYVIAIDGVTPTPTYGGIVFNSYGNFMGTVALMGPGTAPAGMLKVHGAPLQCQIPGIERGNITRCSGSGRPDVWTIDSPSGVVTKATPTPTPKATLTPSISKEITAASDAALQSIQRYESAINSCISQRDILERLTQNSLSNFEFFELCDSLDSDFEELRVKIENFDLRSSNVSLGVTTLKNLSNDIERLTKSINGFQNEIKKSLPLLLALAKSIREVQSWLDFLEESWPEYENRMSTLPKSTQSMIKKNIEFKKALKLANDLDATKEQFQEFIDSGASSLSLEDLTGIANDLKTFQTSLKGYQNFSSTLVVINKLVPSYICSKGQLVASLPKTGKCAPGYSKISTQ